MTFALEDVQGRAFRHIEVFKGNKNGARVECFEGVRSTMKLQNVVKILGGIFLCIVGLCCFERLPDSMVG